VRDDFVQKMNASIDAALERITGVFNERLDKLVPHGLMDEPVPRDEELTEYVSTIAVAPDPTAASIKWIDQTAQQYGHPRARTMFAEYVKRNEKAMAKLAEQDSITTYSPKLESVPEQEY